jgi:hypothetical protein
MKKSKVPERTYEGKMTALRLDPKIRYLAGLAAAASGESLTKYIEGALEESFNLVSLYIQPEREPMYLDDSGKYEYAPIDEKQVEANKKEKLIGNLADSLWSESEFGRIQSLSILAPLHPTAKENDPLYQYIHNRKDLRIPSGKGYKLNRAKIDSEWDSIKADFAKSRKGK